MTAYIALIRKEPKSCYGVDFPDFQGCITGGDSIDEAKDAAAEALQFHIDGMIKDGDAIPKPSSLEKVLADPDNADAVAFLIDVKARREKSVPVTFTIRPSVLARVDASAAAAGSTRSAFLTQAAIEKIERHD